MPLEVVQFLTGGLPVFTFAFIIWWLARRFEKALCDVREDARSDVWALQREVDRLRFQLITAGVIEPEPVHEPAPDPATGAHEFSHEGGGA